MKNPLFAPLKKNKIQTRQHYHVNLRQSTFTSPPSASASHCPAPPAAHIAAVEAEQLLASMDGNRYGSTELLCLGSTMLAGAV